MTKRNKKSRFWEIDSLRGFAIIMMIFYHIFFDINYFKFFLIDLKSVFMLIFLYSIGTIFLLIVGISLSINYGKMMGIFSEQDIQKKTIRRGLKLLAIGFLITFITWIYPHEGFIVFGVLHCIGLSIILATFVLRYKITNLIIGFSFIIIGIILNNYYFNFGFLFWLGLKPEQFYTLDYFPIFPWMGVILVGIYIGKCLYSGKDRNFKIRDLSNALIISFLSFLGKHSLKIYLVHQPMIIGLFLVLNSSYFF